MRLINIETLELESFLYGTIPPYAILSHTWGEDEVTFQEVTYRDKDLSTKRGWRKIPVRYLWVDTCCIDKTSSSELSEAINSMFRWYRESVICYAVLEDVQRTTGDEEKETAPPQLLAPRHLDFFDTNWDWLGSKADLSARISARTRIGEDVILSGEWPFASIAQRMAWAAGRVTTRVEDMAYCLLGIFGVNMAMLYGEGDNAFLRLQEEIIHESDDHSIFAWDAAGKPDSVSRIGAFATSPALFADSADVEPSTAAQSTTYSLTNRGVQISVPVVTLQQRPGESLVVLSCYKASDVDSLIGIPAALDPTAGPAAYARLPAAPVSIPVRDHAQMQHSLRSIYLAKRDRQRDTIAPPLKCHIRGRVGPLPPTFEFIGAHPPEMWNMGPVKTLTLLVPPQRTPVEGANDSGFSTAVLFRFAGAAGSHAFCLVAHLAPNAQSKVRLSLVAAPDEVPEGPKLEQFLERVSGTASRLGVAEAAFLRLGGKSLDAHGVFDASRSSTTFRITLRLR
ncbi:unnamed protein product [Parascedosporium putredinis]|uniref:HET-domain-containing protein n=1 Tax=Parascedosporium putredinis TaxID=1442378 RepID=A0A9P1HAX6_9PEZI|nr:unnamed protein product [Parascedosporium putredinis]CAI8001778.1 unnamed protein product [Parascedosporium putredinis]